MKAILTRVALSLLFLLPAYAFSHGALYFEYAPDAWNSKRLAVSTVQTPAQLFQPVTNISLVAVDVWVDNTGSSGPVTFTLLDELGNSLATKTTTIANIPAIPGGVKYHLDFDTPINLSSYGTYALQISTSLPGFGLYYTDRLNLLEHNETFISPYIQGVARLGNEEQTFTFKYALYGPGSGPVEEAPLPTPTPTSTVQTLITNARVVGTTPSSVTLAWTTNVAADSRASIRTQLNPLYIIASGYDATLELEHTLTVNGLSPSTLYFADVFSVQNTTEPVLTTYTIGFKTAAGLLDEPTEQPPQPDQQESEPTPDSTQTQNPPDQQTQPSPLEPSQTTPPQTDQSSSETLSPNSGASSVSTPPAITGTTGNLVTFSWSAPPSGEPSNGYRIDIFDGNHNLERQLILPPGTHEKEVAQLPKGTHHVVVYADNSGIFTKIALATDFLVRGGVRIGTWILLAVLLLIIAGIVAAILFYRREQKKMANLAETPIL